MSPQVGGDHLNKCMPHVNKSILPSTPTVRSPMVLLSRQSAFLNSLFRFIDHTSLIITILISILSASLPLQIWCSVYIS